MVIFEGKLLVSQSVTSHPLEGHWSAQLHATRLENVWTSSCPWTMVLPRKIDGIYPSAVKAGWEIPQESRFNGKRIYKWRMFPCHVWLSFWDLKNYFKQKQARKGIWREPIGISPRHEPSWCLKDTISFDVWVWVNSGLPMGPQNWPFPVRIWPLWAILFGGRSCDPYCKCLRPEWKSGSRPYASAVFCVYSARNGTLT